MNGEHVISEELWQTATFEQQHGNHWIAYNTVPYYLDPSDVYFFKHQDEAEEFSMNNISECDCFRVIHACSLDEILRQIRYGENLLTHKSNILSLLKNNTMNNENFEYLSDNIKYMGFGENLKTELERNIREGKPEFQLHYATEMNRKPFEATLNFRKSDSTDMYFFNNYNASLKKDNGESTSQTFYLIKGRGITAKEAFNLLEGRSVHKELTTKDGQNYNAWIKLDLNSKDNNNNFEVKQYHENYGFDLREAVGKFPVAELKNPETENALLQSLKKGNIQSVTLESGEGNQKMFIAADPQFKKVDLYDSKGQLQTKEQVKQYQEQGKVQVHEAEPILSTDKKKVVNDETKKGNAKKQTDNPAPLLPKKRQGKGKALGVS